MNRSNKFVPKILYTKNGLEFYLREDGKVISRPIDKAVDYRRQELLPEIFAELDHVRSLGLYPSEAVINNVISFQKECPEKALNYIRYRYLGTCSYLDVFGREADKYYREKKHVEQNERMESKIEDLQQQLEDMQQMMFNMAKMLSPGRKLNAG